MDEWGESEVAKTGLEKDEGELNIADLGGLPTPEENSKLLGLLLSMTDNVEGV